MATKYTFIITNIEHITVMCFFISKFLIKKLLPEIQYNKS